MGDNSGGAGGTSGRLSSPDAWGGAHPSPPTTVGERGRQDGGPAHVGGDCYRSPAIVKNSFKDGSGRAFHQPSPTATGLGTVLTAEVIPAALQPWPGPHRGLRALALRGSSKRGSGGSQ